MDNIKLSVTFVLPGSTMMTSQECEENPKNYNYESVTFVKEIMDGKKIRRVKDVLKFKTRKCRPARQTMNMTWEAYRNFLNTPVEGFNPNIWKRLPIAERISKHLDLIKFDLKATSYTFSILDD